MNTTSSRRLLTLDVIRGITIARVILANNLGSWGYIYAPLKHTQQSDLTPTDLVSPFFMFIMGVSTYVPPKKYNFTFSTPVILRIIKRTIVIFFIGTAPSQFALLCYAHDPLPSGQIRILGVMQRLTFYYSASVLTALLLKHKYISYLIIVLSVGYFIILIIGNGFAYDETSILSIVDHNVLGDACIYQDNHIDPKRLLSTIPSIAHVSIGFCVGKLLTEAKDMHGKLERLFLIGTTLTFAGFLFSYGCLFNKRIWSPTFILVTCRLGSSLLALLVWIIDIKGCGKWSRFLESFGVNPLFTCAIAGATAVLAGAVTVTYQGESVLIQQTVYKYALQPVFEDEEDPLAYTILFVLLNWSISYILYKKKVYIEM